MSLVMDTSDPSTTWVLRLENLDTVPVRIAQDWRLLSLDVTPPPPEHGRAVTVHCALPADMRPTMDVTQTLILPPQRAHVAVIDPRAFCFGGAKERALTPHASVVAHFGFPPDRGRADSLPFVATPLALDRIAVKEVVSEPFMLPEPAAKADGDGGPSEVTETPPTLTVSSPSRIDSGNVRDLTMTVTVTNRSSRRVSVLFNPHTVAIEVTNHFGASIQCQWEQPPAPIAELYTSIPPNGNASTQVLVGDICPPTFMAWPGLYSLRASLDTRRVSGEEIGIHSFVGKVTATEPSLVRIHTGLRGMVRSP
jgi:hypothetical protein